MTTVPQGEPLLLELLEGFAMDVDCRRYHSLEDTITYCYHVAGVVGLMMSHIMGVEEEPVVDLLSLARRPVLQRLLPVGVATLLALVVVRLFRRRAGR